jgi:LacI family transcriptional regulator
MVNVWYNSPVTAVPTIIPDFHGVGRAASAHLLARGLRHLGFLGFRSDRACRDEYEAMREAAAESGASVRRLLVRISYNRNPERWNEFQSQLHRWIDGWPTPFGVHAVSDLLARYAAEACRQRGLRVPEDVAVIGTGDELPICLRPAPSLSSVDCGYRQVGHQAAELLDRLMSGETLDDPLIRLDHLSVIPRHSTDVFAVSDSLVASALRYIAEHCQEPINVGDVVEQLPASRRSLERRFAKVLGRSMAQEISRMRVQRLERLLVESDESLEVLAPRCGFSDTAQMRRNFFQCRGITPSVFREERRT